MVFFLPQGTLDLESLRFRLRPSFWPPQGIGQEVIEDKQILVQFPPIADTSYQRFRFYQIRKGQASGTETNMPLVIIDHLDPGVIQQASGFDIRAFNSVGVDLPYESIDIIINGDTSADIILHFKMGIVRDDEWIQLTFGKPSATDGANKTAVWDNNFVVSQHMNQQTGDIIDSTVNNNDGVLTNTPTNTTGKIGNAKFFGGISAGDAYVTLANPSLDTTNITVYNWINIRSNNGFHLIASKWFDGTQDWHFSVRDAMLNLFFPDDMNITSGMNISINQDHLVGFIIRDTTTLEMYMDGDLAFTQTINPKPISSTSKFQIGDTRQVPIGLDGWVDEFAMINSAKSANWMKTTYNNQNDNDAFWFKTPLLINGEDNFLVDHLGNRIVAEGN